MKIYEDGASLDSVGYLTDVVETSEGQTARSLGAASIYNRPGHGLCVCGTSDAFSRGKVVRLERCSTTIRDLYGILATVRKPRVTVIEEGPLADWLLRSLGEWGETLVVCDPPACPRQ